MRSLNNYGSAAPLIVFLLAFVIGGFVIGLIGMFLDPVIVIDTTMDGLMSKAWLVAVPVICLIILASWLFMKAQKENFKL